jgi:hypothetical protein
MLPVILPWGSLSWWLSPQKPPHAVYFDFDSTDYRSCRPTQHFLQCIPFQWGCGTAHSHIRAVLLRAGSLCTAILVETDKN